MTANSVKKKVVLIDLDIVTVSLWDKIGKNKEKADHFLNRVKNLEFTAVTPMLLIDVVERWRHQSLKSRIKEFYKTYSSRIYTDIEIKEKCRQGNIDYESVLDALEQNGVKREDAALVLVASLFSCDALVTFNRVHLRNKKEAVNQVLVRWSLLPIQIAGPEEL